MGLRPWHLLQKIIIQPHKTPDSCLEMERQPGGLKQILACNTKMPPAPAGGVSLPVSSFSTPSAIGAYKKKR
jgi:hypothetical protein